MTVDGAHDHHTSEPTPCHHSNQTIRRTAAAGVLLAAAALVLLTVGATTTDNMHAFNLGLTLAVGSIIAGVGYAILNRMDAIEAGQRHTADCIGQLADDGGDELGRWRRSG